MTPRKVWNRLRTIEVGAPSEESRIANVVASLESNDPLASSVRKEASRLLRMLRDSPKAQAILFSKGKGRPRNSPAPDIALDLVAQKELLGRRRAKQAVGIVADAWTEVLGRKISIDTVEDAYTDWKAGARYRLSELIDHLVGRERGHMMGCSPEYWTRAELLEAVSLDVRDQHRPENRKKSR